MTDQTTRKLGKYNIIKELGYGVPAVVYKALGPELERLVAPKLLHPHLAADPEFAARFTWEARAAAGLFHLHIVTVSELWEEQGQLYIAMHYPRPQPCRPDRGQGGEDMKP